MGRKFQFCKIKSVLEMDGGGGCTTIQTNLKYH